MIAGPSAERLPGRHNDRVSSPKSQHYQELAVHHRLVVPLVGAGLSMAAGVLSSPASLRGWCQGRQPARSRLRRASIFIANNCSTEA